VPKTKHTVVLPDGRTAQRVSQNRVYSHVVVGRRSYEIALANATAASAEAIDRKRHEIKRRRALGLPGDYVVSSFADLNEQFAREAAAFIAEHPDVQAYVAERRAARVAKVEAAKADGVYDRWNALTWASRPDLAQRAQGASEWAAYETRVLEVTR